MMRLCFTLFIALAIALVDGVPLTPSIAHFEPVRNHNVFHHFNGKREAHAFSDGVHVEFDAFGRRFEYDMDVMDDLFADHAMVTIHHENGQVESFKPVSKSYKGTGPESWRLRLTIADEVAMTYNAQLILDDDVYFIDPVSVHHHQMSDEARGALDADTTHVVYRASDMLPDPALEGAMLGHIDADTQEVKRSHLNPRAVQQSLANPARVPPPAPCPQTLKSITQGVAADSSYISVVGGSATAQSEIQRNWATMSAIYERDVNIQIKLGEIILSPGSSTFTWSNCPGDISNHLNIFSAWRGAQSTKPEDLWHLMTNCYPPPGTVGLAWVGVVCRKTANNFGSSTASGTGVTSHIGSVGSSSGHHVAAHETGHNFGSSHSPEGVMVASNVQTNIFAADSQTSMCDHLGSRTCLADTAPCSPQCSGKNCGSDGCGGSCGSCSGTDICTSNVCTANTCSPNCAGRSCGDDGCGGSCGSCGGSSSCSASGACVDTSDDQAAFLAVHNTVRAAKGVPALTWDSAAASVAEAYAKRCIWGHNSARGNLGENIAASTAGFNDATKASESWAAEEDSWNCQTNTCNGVCGHYTQMVWEDTTGLGCWHETCSTGSPFGSGSWENIVCNYSPPGNFIGRHPFGTDQCNGATAPNPPPPCVPVTCAAQGRNCGTISDGCGGTLNCGSCGNNAVCASNGQCQCVPFRTCTGLNAQCTSDLVAGTPDRVLDNGCGSTLNCGTCTGDDICNSAFQCECQPTGCPASQNCGTVSDGCGGTVSCGTCSAGQDCVSGVCQGCSPTPGVCDARQCGVVSDGCGQVSCGQCTAGETCVGGQCTCVPRQSCASQGRHCGTFTDDCGNTVDCGPGCTSGQTCQAGVCVGCDAGCPLGATCTGTECVCDPGFSAVGDICVINVDVPPRTDVGPGNWQILRGTAEKWTLAGDELEHSGSSEDTMQWLDSVTITNDTMYTFRFEHSVGNSESYVGFATRISDADNFLNFQIRGDGSVYIGAYLGGHSGTFGPYARGLAVAQNEFYFTELIIQNNFYTLDIAGTRVGPFRIYWPVNEGYFGPVGVVANGDVTVRNVSIASSTEVRLAVQGCISESEFRDRVANILGISPSQVTGVRVVDGECAVNKRDQMTKRQAAAAVTTYAFSLVGSSTASSATLASTLNTMVASNAAAVSGSFVPAAVGTTAVAPVATGTVIGVSVAGIGAAAGVAAGLTAGQVAGVVIGVLAVGGAAAGGAKVVHDKRKKEDLPGEIVPEPVALDASPRKVKGGVDLYNMDPDQVHSITARSPAVPRV